VRSVVLQAEWWKFIAIIVASGALQKGGASMFEKRSNGGITQSPNIGEKVGLALRRFNQIRGFFVEALKDPHVSDPTFCGKI
jgi:hypothetical protein